MPSIKFFVQSYFLSSIYAIPNFFQMAWILLADIDINRHGILTIAYKYMMCQIWNLPFFSLTHFFRFVCSFCFVLFCFLWHRVSLHSPGCLGTTFVDQSWTQKSACLCLRSVGIKGLCHHCPARVLCLLVCLFLFLFCFVLKNFSQVKSMVSFSFQKIEIQKNYKCYELQIRLH